MNSELHIIILWSKARYKEKEIITDIGKTFEIVKSYEITWSKDKVYQNYSRFYALKSRYAKSKMKHCGTDEFLLLVVKDHNPIYVERKTNSGIEKVNRNIFDKKELYRKWTDESHKIHATNSIEEVRHNLALFFGVSYEQFLSDIDNTGERIKINRDLVGTNGWNSFEELFFVLNNTINYCVLRNFEGFFENMYSDEHLDIDLLVENYTEAKLILSGVEKYPLTKRVANEVTVQGTNVNFDIRSVSDGYMCTKWNQDILEQRVFNKVGYFSPNRPHHLYSLLYHALVHKESISQDYEVKFSRLSEKFGVITNSIESKIDTLNKYMAKNSYTFCEPKDMSVFYNNIILDNHISRKRAIIYKYRKVKSFIKQLILSGEK